MMTTVTGELLRFSKFTRLDTGEHREKCRCWLINISYSSSEAPSFNLRVEAEVFLRNFLYFSWGKFWKQGFALLGLLVASCNSRFIVQKFYFPPSHCTYVFHMDFGKAVVTFLYRMNIGFYNRYGMCLLGGTREVLKQKHINTIS